jgi:hypothetical protein
VKSFPFVTTACASLRFPTAWIASFGAVTAPSLSCAVPTLSGGRLA